MIDATCKEVRRTFPRLQAGPRRKVNVCADNGDDVLNCDLTPVQKLKRHGITDLISLMEQAP